MMHGVIDRRVKVEWVAFFRIQTTSFHHLISGTFLKKKKHKINERIFLKKIAWTYAQMPYWNLHDAPEI